MITGSVIFLAGAAIWLTSRMGLSIGRLPGDFSWEGKNVKVYFPFATMLIVSVVLTIILNVISKTGRK
jgi:hypothetical protein